MNLGVALCGKRGGCFDGIFPHYTKTMYTLFLFFFVIIASFFFFFFFLVTRNGDDVIPCFAPTPPIRTELVLRVATFDGAVVARPPRETSQKPSAGGPTCSSFLLIVINYETVKMVT